VAKESGQKAGALDANKTGMKSGLLAEETELDRRALWRIGTWGFTAVGAVALAITANQWSLGLRRDRVSVADLARQAQQIQSLTKESQNETRRLVAAIDTLNNDRDRLFARVTVLEQGLDSVTGTIAKQKAADAAAAQSLVASAMPAMMTPPATTPADSRPAAAPAQTETTAPAATATAAEASPPPDKPGAETANPAPGTVAALPQIPSNKPATPQPPAQIAAFAPAVPLGAAKSVAKSIMGPPDPGAPKLVEPAKELSKEPVKTGTTAKVETPSPAPAQAAAPAAPETADNPTDADKPKDQDKAVLDADAAGATIQRTEFAIDLGTANSIGGLRALWRGLLKSNNAELAELQPIIMLRESNTGLGMQIRLAAGPLHDAAAAAKICASLGDNQRTCETTVFDGQRLAMSGDEPRQATATKPQPTAKPQSSRRYTYRHSKKEEPPPPAAAAAPTPAPQGTSTFSSLFGMKRN